MIKIGLDIATSMGVCFYNGTNFVCTTYTGTPIEQLETLQDVVGEDLKGAKIYIEQENTFRNANTTRSILHRVGYLKNSLEKIGAEIVMVNAMSARKHLGAKCKADVSGLFSKFGLNSDESDALAVLMFGEQLPLDVLAQNVIKMEGDLWVT